MEGRQILDLVIIANEVINSRLRSFESGVICVLDIKKVYDHINYCFFACSHKKIGFGFKFVRWMKWCTSTTHFSLLVNGTPCEFF